MFIEQVDGSPRAVLAPLLAAIRDGAPGALATILAGARDTAPRHTLIPARAGHSIRAADVSLDRVRALADTSATRILDLPVTDTACVRRLRGAEVTEAQLGRLAAPICLDLAADSPEETAVSIAAEIVAQRRSGSGQRLPDLDSSIHHAGETTTIRCDGLRFGA